MTSSPPNADPAELARFEEIAHGWWDPDGGMRPLHDLNPVRLAWVDERLGLYGKRVADVGCGGGILAESMAARGARVVGIDLAAGPLEVARLHALESGVAVDYRLLSAEALAAAEPGAFDAVTCMELLEHVPDPAATLAACARLVRPGGHVFLSTVNRTAAAYLLGVVAAEYVLGLLPRGTHDYARFIRPAELTRWLRAAGLDPVALAGVRYNPLTHHASLGGGLDLNYLAHATRPEEPAEGTP
ncbi:MAG: bifunctional 2-polyprenyl-6-hydroxyphenol methylase/3-demethylubiquinol 3-O-methyltransferase UbiG [Gammaproteobacteria bacterium]|jgi:2-polyprenyl-6-hydroxyphenyl methylase/3-demethylubiquinone-9 3-methyltransferase|nr:bifunctional 2-polyprenyl-6-hydroxyphenol methylase/3-demethylubiquinol 3-O-methyltransferase UbiG [Gammaproteobacteria bacterium]